MKFIFLVSFLLSCAHQGSSPLRQDLVSIVTALNQAQASYLRGCVDILKDLKIPNSFNGCRDKSLIHRREIEEIVNGDLLIER